MRFQFEGRTYAIEFQRETQQVGHWVDHKVRRYTTARVIAHGEGTPGVVMREAKVACYYKDQFSHEGGRKAALAKALYDAPTVKGGEPIIGKRLPKEFKRAIWIAYHTRPRA